MAPAALGPMPSAAAASCTFRGLRSESSGKLKELMPGESVEASPRQVPQSPDSLAGGWKYIFPLTFGQQSAGSRVAVLCALSKTHLPGDPGTHSHTGRDLHSALWSCHPSPPSTRDRLAGEQAEALPLRTCLSVRGWGPQLQSCWPTTSPILLPLLLGKAGCRFPH